MSVVLGITMGLLMPEYIFNYTDIIIDFGLCLLLFFVGIDIGRNKGVFNDIKKIGLKVLLIPIMIIIGSISGSVIAGFFVGLPVNESSAVGAGFGWYSLSAMLLSEYSTELSALAFISNVVREILAIIFIPIIAKYIGDVESVAPAGATAMDTSLPIISKATNPEISIIAFITGVVLSSLVPILVPMLINL
ncbi:lysine exporter LysO family protein [Thermohalobacter berrensis]|uniref:lysine exporter LysO family protein n=1 Tax=Thermohalobacter berrensis TaxID=99594 RepID=UPI00242AD4A2|nr:lysine exporter LysO family protein [Thermohalobacter berrensis]